MAELTVAPTPDPEKNGAPPPAPEPESSSGAAPVGDGRTFSQLLAGAMGAAPSVLASVPMVAAPCFIAPASALFDSAGFPGQFSMTHQAVLATVTAQAHMQLQAATPSVLVTKASPQPTVSAASPLPLQQSPLPGPNDSVCMPVVDQPPSSSQKSQSDEPPLSDQKPQSAHIVVKAATSDGYNWRKYGQKQVKNKDHSRSYYKCTIAYCLAKKKVEHSPDGRVTEIIYRDQHNHEPPHKSRCLRERGTQVSAPVEEDEKLDLLNREPNESDPSTSKMEHIFCNKSPENQLGIVEKQLNCPGDCEEGAEIKAEGDPADEPYPRQRLGGSPLSCSAPVFRSARDAKTVVQTACDVGIVSDGYRWRKYGQKMVKGNPNPRSYYRCTHIGCPVRKHVERASEDANALVITYEGKHNHDLPSPKHANYLPDQKHSSESLRDIDRERTGEKALQLGGDKALESAQALLSIRSNSVTTNDSGETNGSTQRPIFKESEATVPVQNS